MSATNFAAISLFLNTHSHPTVSHNRFGVCLLRVTNNIFKFKYLDFIFLKDEDYLSRHGTFLTYENYTKWPLVRFVSL